MQKDKYSELEDLRRDLEGVYKTFLSTQEEISQKEEGFKSKQAKKRTVDFKQFQKKLLSDLTDFEKEIDKEITQVERVDLKDLMVEKKGLEKIIRKTSNYGKKLRRVAAVVFIGASVASSYATLSTPDKPTKDPRKEMVVEAPEIRRNVLRGTSGKAEASESKKELDEELLEKSKGDSPKSEEFLNLTGEAISKESQEKIKLSYEKLEERFGVKNDKVIIIDGKKQRTYLVKKDQNKIVVLKGFKTSTGIKGFGQSKLTTASGVHRVYKKIGEGRQIGAVFKGRKYTGRTAEIKYDGGGEQSSALMTTRILQLDGLEENNKNTIKRYIYIHGTNKEGLLGQPDSHGCIRVGNREVVELFDSVKQGTLVDVVPI